MSQVQDANAISGEQKDGRPNGEAFVEFVEEIAVEEAIKYHKSSIGSRYVEIFKSSRADMMQAQHVRSKLCACVCVCLCAVEDAIE